MHEMSYCESVLEAVKRRAGDRAVANIGVRMGVFHRVVADAFEQSFQMAAGGTIAQDAGTEVTQIPGTARCWDCQAEFEAMEPSPACPACGSLEVSVEGGDEVILEWIEYREAAPQAPIVDPELIPPHVHEDDHHSHHDHDHAHAAGGR